MSIKSGIKLHDEEQRLSMPDIVYRSLMFIMENASVGNNSAVHELIDNLEDTLAPYLDKQYNEAMAAAYQMKKKKANNSSARAYYNADHNKKIYRIKHRELVKLAFRLGWLGNLQGQRITEISNMGTAYNE